MIAMLPLFSFVLRLGDDLKMWAIDNCNGLGITTDLKMRVAKIQFWLVVSICSIMIEKTCLKFGYVRYTPFNLMNYTYCCNFGKQHDYIISRFWGSLFAICFGSSILSGSFEGFTPWVEPWAIVWTKNSNGFGGSRSHGATPHPTLEHFDIFWYIGTYWNVLKRIETYSKHIYLKTLMTWGSPILWSTHVFFCRGVYPRYGDPMWFPWGWLPWHPPTMQRTTRRTTIVAGTRTHDTHGFWSAESPTVPLKSTLLEVNFIWLMVWLPCFIFPYIGNFIIPIDFHTFQRGWNHQPVIISEHVKAVKRPTSGRKNPRKKPTVPPKMFDFETTRGGVDSGDLPNWFCLLLLMFDAQASSHQGFDLRPFLFPAAFDAQFEAIDEVVKACALGS